MNKPITLRDKLNLLIKADENPPSFEQLNDELHTKGATGFRSLALSDSLSLDLALFFHKYFAVTFCAVLLMVIGSAWVAFSSFVPATHPSVQSTTSSFAQDIAAPVQSHKVSINAIRDRSELSSRSVTKIVRSSAANNYIPTSTDEPLLDEECLLGAIEPRDLPNIIMPNTVSIPSRIALKNLRLSDPPLDYSGITLSMSFEQSRIPANPEFAASNENDLNYSMGYRFDVYNEAGIGYSRHIYRNINPTITTWTVDVGGVMTTYHQTIWHDSDNPISLPGIYYTFHANNLEIFGVEPFATVFASKPSAGFLWRASAGIEWNAWDNLNAVVTYSQEQLNSPAYSAPQNAHTFLDFGLSYLW